MTNTSGSQRTGPGIPPGNRWERFVDDMAECGHDVIDQVSERAKRNGKLAQTQQYGLDEWLDDVKWFWQSVGDVSKKCLESLRDTRPPGTT